MAFDFHLGAVSWEELREEFARILSDGRASLTLSIGLTSGEGGHTHHHGEHVHVETAFTMRVREKAKEIEGELGGKAYLHLHPDSGTITLDIPVSPSNLEERFRRILETLSGCEGCYITGLEGEVKVDGETAALIYGTSAKATFILPSADGKRLKIIEALLTV